MKTLEKGQSASLVSGHLFGGNDSDQQNALHDALILAAADYAMTIPEDAKRGTDTKSGIYQFVEETPATSMVVELVAALNKLGWRIVPAKSSPNKWYHERKFPGETHHPCHFNAKRDGYCFRHHPSDLRITLTIKRDRLTEQLAKVEAELAAIEPVDGPGNPS